MSRLRGSGVELSGTKFDQRRGAGDVKKMRSRDLEVHIRRLGEFNNRTSRYMQTDSGPAGPETVNPFLKAQRAVNKGRREKMERYGDIKSPISDENMRQRWGVYEKTQRRMNDPAHNNPFREVDRKGIKYRTPNAIQKMTDSFEAQLDPEFEDNRRDDNRETLAKMLNIIGDVGLSNIATFLTDDQFDLLWFNPDFMTGQGFVYSQVEGRDKDNMTKGDIEAMDLRIENETEEATKLVRWALQN